ncbi:H-2 class I histocompatibility antigen, L-D alpha chain-like isoform X1 [Lates japonicus]|uniref:H-2 class I histocompatibility antigen, L-D alpha chain-like isoform X1 n=1 Tax=Lates japonicus TaxID=270547 RepID=A0AAD3MQL0_LATJO|nr:H-2 class I histocompatibility antigen, L-D alpha chain-like isoform X1 [Lates japonicus]
MNRPPTWIFLFLPLMWLNLEPVRSGYYTPVASPTDIRKNTTYIYTAFSKTCWTSGIHEFTAMGLLTQDDWDHFDSYNPKKVPKEKWMKSAS